MKSKSFNLPQAHGDNSKINKTFDFIQFYKSASETETNVLEKPKSDDNHAKKSSQSKQETSKREHSPYKNRKKRKNKPVDISHVSIDGSNLNSSVGPSTPRNEPRTTSTPIAGVKAVPTSKVKSIMKTSVTHEDDVMDGTKTIITKPKKRNKSVSFMLDDNEEVVVKRTKSEDSIAKKKDSENNKHKFIKDKKKQLKNVKKERLLGKENKVGDINHNVEKHKERIVKKKLQSDKPSETSTTNNMEQNEPQDKKKKVKRAKKDKKEPQETTSNSEIITEQPTEPKPKKVKKVKHQVKTENEEEPASKTRKKDLKPDIIAEDLENLSIGDNAHTLTSLLDEMQVADKSKRIKTKGKLKEKKTTVINETLSEDEKEKVKWKKRKWNKDKKADVDLESLATSVIIENLPISLMLTYKKILADYFSECGLIKHIGLAEMYPTVETTPVFTTTINFYSDGGATEALEKNHALLEGNHIRVKRPLPATETTLVLRTYAELTEQLICSLFAGAGKIRNIRHVVKGKRSAATAFVEMDGPESVKKALKIAKDAKIGGKRVHVNKFEMRSSKKPKNEDKPENNDSN
ncbi:ABC transporter F family member 4 [Manduca sexta]|uniref:ABC transporter F family member 4 n=1 Tax=Manduca sexta TaxID=7130 RepID=UPI00188F5C33|nr:ABC transporter F family member 4 [Manduca sexta]